MSILTSKKVTKFLKKDQLTKSDLTRQRDKNVLSCARQGLVLLIQRRYSLESIQDFLIKLDMNPCMHLVEIRIFSLNLVIVRLTKIVNRADKNWTQFQEIKYLQNQNFQKHFSIKLGLLVKYSSQKFFFVKILPIFNTEK